MPILDLGRLVATASVTERMKKDYPFNHFIAASIERFQKGDWGTISEGDKLQNNDGLEKGEGSIHGVYKMPDVKTPLHSPLWL